MEEQELRVQEHQTTIAKCTKALEGLRMNTVNGETPVVPIFEDENELSRYKEHEMLQLKHSVEESEGRKYQLILRSTGNVESKFGRY